MTPTVAILFARADSVYKTLPGCDVYDIERDALTFPGGPSPGATQSGRPTSITTPDWPLYPVEGGVIVVNKETNAGIRLDAETVTAIAELVGAA